MQVTTSSTFQIELDYHKLIGINSRASHSYRSQIFLQAKSMNSRIFLFHSSCLPAIHLCSNFGQSKYMLLHLVYYHFQIHLHRYLHLQKCTILNKYKITFSILFSSLPIALIFISSRHLKLSMTFLEIVPPLTLINISIRILINSLFPSLTISPCSLIFISICILNASGSMLFVIKPFSLIFSSCLIMISSFS